MAELVELRFFVGLAPEEAGLYYLLILFAPEFRCME